MVMKMADPTTEYVTYRELIAMLDSRDAKCIAQYHDITRRVEHLDDHGSRGLQQVTDRLDATVKALETHNIEHKEQAKQGITARQWWVTTGIGFAGVLLALWSQLPT